jgi:hypothetical protein
VENFYLEVRVIEAVNQDLVTDAEVTIEAIPIGKPEVQSFRVEATHDIAPIPTEYAAHLPLMESGVWEIKIMVDGKPGYGEITYLQRISTRNSIGPVLSVGAPVVGLAALILVFLWLQKKKPAPSDHEV